MGTQSKKEDRDERDEKGGKKRETRRKTPNNSLDEAVASGRGLRAGDIIDVVAQGDEQVEEELAAAVVHLELHRATALEGGAATDDEGEVVGPQLGVGVGRVGVGVARRRQNGAALDAGLQPLLAQGDALQLLEPVLVRHAVNDRVLEQGPAGVLVVDSRLDGAAAAVGRLLDLPRVAALAVHEARVVVALVHVLEDRGEDLGGFVRQGDALGRGLDVLALQDVREVWRVAEDVLVSGEDSLLVADYERDDGADTTVSKVHVRMDEIVRIVRRGH